MYAHAGMYVLQSRGAGEGAGPGVCVSFPVCLRLRDESGGESQGLSPKTIPLICEWVESRWSRSLFFFKWRRGQKTERRSE